MLIVRCLETALAELGQIRIATANGLARYSSLLMVYLAESLSTVMRRISACLEQKLIISKLVFVRIFGRFNGNATNEGRIS